MEAADEGSDNEKCSGNVEVGITSKGIKIDTRFDGEEHIEIINNGEIEIDIYPVSREEIILALKSKETKNEFVLTVKLPYGCLKEIITKAMGASLEVQ